LPVADALPETALGPPVVKFLVAMIYFLINNEGYSLRLTEEILFKKSICSRSEA